MNYEYQVLESFEKDTLWLHKNLDKLRAKFENKFVAIKEGDVIASDNDIEKIIKKLQESNINPSFTVIEFIHKKGVQLIL